MISGDNKMPIVGFNFTKTNGERTEQFTIDKKIKSDLKISKVEKEKLSLGGSGDVARFEFEFSVEYQDCGEMVLGGNVLYMDEPEKIKEIIESWEKKKKTDENVMNQVLNTVLFRCNIKALNVSQDLGLPPHFRLPRVTPKKTTTTKKKKK